MRSTRVYINKEIEVGINIELTGQTSHYLHNVLRLGPDNELTIFNGNGHDYKAKITDASRKKTTLTVLGQSEKKPLPSLNIHLGISLSKGDRFDWAIQKSTELGVTAITPLVTEFSTLKISEDRLEKKHQHWLGIIESACEQSGRCYVPELHHPVNLNDWANALGNKGTNDSIIKHENALKLVLNPHQGQRIHSQTCEKNLALMIGPEGGLSEKEIEIAHDNGFVSIQLGNLVLRTETAPVAAIAAAQTLWGSFR